MLCHICVLRPHPLGRVRVPVVNLFFTQDVLFRIAGAMFDYISRGKSRGWSVIVADPHGEQAPHRHLQRLFRESS
jgi:hypothetical protein